MRTGAIFARGSCRALKWLALVGVVFALGAGQALAQATAVTSATIGNVADDYSLKIMLVTMDDEVWGSTPAGSFSVGIGNVATGISLAAAAPGETTFKLTFPYDVDSTVVLTYTQPPEDSGNRLLTADGADDGEDPDEVAGLTGTVTVADTAPILPDVSRGEWTGPFPVDVALPATGDDDVITMPEVEKGGNAPFTYSMANLPAGLTFTADSREIPMSRAFRTPARRPAITASRP